MIVPHSDRRRAARVGLHVVSGRVDYQRGAAVGVDRVASAVLHRDLVVGNRGLGVALGVTVKFIMSPACGPAGFFSRAFGGGIEVLACAGERRLALATEWSESRARRAQALQVERDRDAHLAPAEIIAMPIELPLASLISTCFMPCAATPRTPAVQPSSAIAESIRPGYGATVTLMTWHMPASVRCRSSPACTASRCGPGASTCSITFLPSPK